MEDFSLKNEEKYSVQKSLQMTTTHLSLVSLDAAHHCDSSYRGSHSASFFVTLPSTLTWKSLDRESRSISDRIQVRLYVRFFVTTDDLLLSQSLGRHLTRHTLFIVLKSFLMGRKKNSKQAVTPFFFKVFLFFSCCSGYGNEWHHHILIPFPGPLFLSFDAKSSRE